MSSRNGGADPGAYWGLVRVERKADKGAVPQVLQPPATVGAAEDRAFCTFCGGSFSAQPHRIIGHFAFVFSQARPPLLGVANCKGPERNADESERDYEPRQQQFKDACAAMHALYEEKKAAADRKAQQEAQDKATAPGSFVGGGAPPRPHKQLKMTDTKAGALKATTDLARGMIAANIPPNVLRNKYFRRALLSVRLPRALRCPRSRWTARARWAALRARARHSWAGCPGSTALATQRGVPAKAAAPPRRPDASWRRARPARCATRRPAGSRPALTS
jgi:hypothetical protein